MKRFGVIGAALLLLSGCAANDTEPPSNLEGAVSEAPAANASAPAVTDGQLHTLSVELMTYQGGTNGRSGIRCSPSEASLRQHQSGSVHRKPYFGNHMARGQGRVDFCLCR